MEFVLIPLIVGGLVALFAAGAYGRAGVEVWRGMGLAEDGVVRWFARPAVIRVAGVVVLVVAVPVLIWVRVNGAPFVMKIGPATGGASVQFFQRESREGGTVVSPVFQVPVPVLDAAEIELTRSTHAVPYGEIEFQDTTILPGRFTIRFGDVTLDVMSAGIIENGETHAWQPESDLKESSSDG